MKKHFTEDVWMANTHMKTYSASLAVKEMPMKIMVRDFHTPIRTIKVNM